MLPDAVDLRCGDSLRILGQLADNSVDSIVTDPPYELGLLGRAWDASGIAYNVDLWSEALRVLRPGGHLIAFGGTRTFHRTVCAIEDAGFQVRDMLAWLYSVGMPKSLNLRDEWEGWGTA
ncbi:MAG TPA: DNA methyltransferase, partial [Noviherbaspirillum sp.]